MAIRGADPLFFVISREIKKEIRRFLKGAGVERIELPSAVLETDVLPLYDTPKNKKSKFAKM